MSGTSDANLVAHIYAQISQRAGTYPLGLDYL